MTSQRSKEEVKVAMENLGLHPVAIEIGEIEIEEKLSLNTYSALKNNLLKNDFELVTDKEIILIEKIKSVIIEMIHYSDELPNTKYSDYISKKLNANYTSLSKFFSKVKHITIEQFIIAHKIERVKQLLLFNELTLSEVAWKLRYSSTAHLSAQFKKVTGLTPSLFKKLKDKKILPPENV
jgi:AraC-like DNA-binding protein